jgi:hypothetical protein
MEKKQNLTFKIPTEKVGDIEPYLQILGWSIELRERGATILAQAYIEPGQRSVEFIQNMMII